MTRRCWIADEFSDNRAALIGSHADHLSRVLRARIGQEFDLSTGEVVRRGRIVAIHDRRIEFELAEELPATTVFQIAVALAIFKFDRMEWAIEKCTELGVTRIIPVIARRTGAHLAAAAQKRVERWQRIARQASEQSRRGVPPEIAEPVNVKEAVALNAATRILLAEADERMLLKDVLGPAPADGEIILAVGPEGGWTESELELFTNAGWIAASLGGNILRAETATIAATAIVVSELQ